nr:hypothetical protein [Gelidibacter maritimus]
MYELPYYKDELNPIIMEEPFDYQYGERHAAYVNKLSNLIKDTSLEDIGRP